MNGWSWMQSAHYALEPVLFQLVNLAVVHCDSVGTVHTETTGVTSGRAVIGHCSWQTELSAHEGCSSVQLLGPCPSFSGERAVSWESITLHKHFLSSLSSPPYSLLSYKTHIHFMADKGQKQKLVEIRAREVWEDSCCLKTTSCWKTIREGIVQYRPKVSQIRT